MGHPEPIRPQLPLMRYRLRFQPQGRGGSARRGNLPSADAYLGSAWRGAFGHALRRAACVTKAATCDNCPLLDDCVYPRTFESRTPTGAKKLSRYPTTPNPYVLEPASAVWEAEDRTVRLGLVLFGEANGHSAAVLQALTTAAREGLTAHRIALRLLDIQAEAGEPDSPWRTLQEADGPLRTVPARHIAPPPAPAAVIVRLLAPTRLRASGQPVDADAFRLRAFAANLLRRVSLLTYFYGEQPFEIDFAELLHRVALLDVGESQLLWREHFRYSSRQHARVPMGGLVGRFAINAMNAPELATLWTCLWLGQWTHVGKGCVMGLGRYVLEIPDETPAKPRPWPTPAPL